MGRAWASVRTARSILVSRPKHASSQKLGQVQNRPAMLFCANATKDAKWPRTILSCASDGSRKGINDLYTVAKNREIGCRDRDADMQKPDGCTTRGSRRWSSGRLGWDPDSHHRQDSHRQWEREHNVG